MQEPQNNLFTMLLQLVDTKGIDLSSSLAAFIDDAALHLHERKDNDYAKLTLNTVINLVKDVEIGLKLAPFISPNVFNGLGYLFLTAGTIQKAFESVAVFPGAYHNLIQIEVSEQGDTLVVTIENTFTEAGAHIVGEGAIAILANYLRWVIKDEYQNIEICFAHQPLTDLKKYLQYLHLTPTFGAARTCLIIPMALSKAPLHSADSEYHQHLRAKLNTLHFSGQAYFTDKVKIAIRARLENGEHTKVKVADHFAISEKTLDRRLANENTTFRLLLEKTRLELATIYLSDPELSIEEVTSKLGYRDRSAFSKAYKNWTGKTPRA
ncbi:MAG: AraC family transcriptional regulator [Pseudomonadales bacterium]|nr:AraC family transcriptional regulator [Pseudomonadales bacterium]